MKDKEQLLYQAVLIWKMREEIGWVMSKLGELKKKTQDEFMTIHWCNYDRSRILLDVLKKHYPHIYQEKGKSIQQMFEESEKEVNEIIRKENEKNRTK